MPAPTWPDVRAELGLVYNLRDDYGLVGDDATDNTAAATAAFADLPSRAQAYLPEGTYQLENVPVTGFDYIRIFGPGTLKQKAGSGTRVNGGLLDISDCEIVEVELRKIDGNNLAGAGPAREARAQIHITSRDGGTKRIYIGPHEQVNSDENGIFIRSEIGETGPDEVLVRGAYCAQVGTQPAVYVWGGGGVVRILESHTEDPLHLCDPRHVQVIGKPSPFVDGFRHVELTGFAKYTKQAAIRISNADTQDVDYRGEHHNEQADGTPSPVGTPFYKPDNINADEARYGGRIRVKLRNTRNLASTKAITLEDGVRHYDIVDPDVDSIIDLGATSGGDPGHTNRLIGGILRGEFGWVEPNIGCIIEGTIFDGGPSASSLSDAVASGGDHYILRNIILRNFKRVKIVGAQESIKIDGLEMDSTSQLLISRSGGEETFLTLRRVWGGDINLVTSGGIDSALHVDMRDCWFDSGTNFLQLQDNADLLALDCWFWNSTNSRWELQTSRHPQGYVHTLTVGGAVDLRPARKHQTDGSGITITAVTLLDGARVQLILATGDTLDSGAVANLGADVVGPAAVDIIAIEGSKYALAQT